MQGAAPRKIRQLSERELIAMMALLMALQAFGIDAMLPALGAMASDLGTAGNDRQLIIGAYLLGSGLGALIPGAFADRYGRRPVLAFGLVFYIVLSAACALTTDYTTLVILRLVQGAGCAGLSVLPAAIVRDRVGGDRMARMMSLIMMVFLVVPIVAPAIGQLILTVASWRAIFGAMVVVSAVVGVWVWWRLPETLTDENRQEIAPRIILRNMREAVSLRGSIGYIIGSALVFGSLFGFLNSSQQLIGETFGAGDSFALVFGGAVLGMVIANFTNSRIVERFGARRVSHTALFAFIIISALQLWFASQPDQTLVSFIILMSGSMASLGFIGANFGSIAMQPFFHIAGAASSAHQFLRMSTGALLGGFIGQTYDGSAQPLATAMVCCGLLALATILFSERGKLFGRRVPDVDPVPAE